MSLCIPPLFPKEFTDGIRSHKRLTQQKKHRERERKDLETLGRRHLTNVRVVQRNVAYIVNMNPRFAKEEVGPTAASPMGHFVAHKLYLVDLDLTFQRLLRPIREDIQDRDRQTHVHEPQEPGHRSLCHIPQEGGRCSVYWCCRWGSSSWRGGRCNAGKLRNYEVLYDIPSRPDLLRSRLYAPSRLGGREGLFHEGGPNNVVRFRVGLILPSLNYPSENIPSKIPRTECE